MFHTPLCHLPRPLFYHTYRPSKNTLHTYQNVLAKNSDNHSYNSYTLSFLFGNPFANHFMNFVHGQQIVFHSFLIIFGLLNIIKELISIFRFPFSIVFYVPLTGLNLPVQWYFISHREGWNTPDYSIIWLSRIVTIF